MLKTGVKSADILVGSQPAHSLIFCRFADLYGPRMSKKMLFRSIMLLVLAFTASTLAAETNEAPVLFMIGDSTMANKPLNPPQPERGWGQLMPVYFKPEVRVENLAVDGRSSKSFRAEGRWERVMQHLKPGDYVIIQFGHNDEKPDAARHTEAMGSFKENLARYVRETRKKRGNPILATPIVRRAFSSTNSLMDTHGDYAPAVRQVAAEEMVPLLDLQKRTETLVQSLGPELSKKLYMWIEPGEYKSLPQGRRDNTHLNPLGASRVCDLAVDEIRTAVPGLARWLRGNP